MTPSSSTISLGWTAASGAAKYRVERKSAGSAYELLTTTTSTSTSDTGTRTGSAYLYRVCAADTNNNCTSDYSNIALGAKINFTTDPTICAASDSSCGDLTTIKHEHISELRTAIDAVRTLAGQSAASYTHTTISAGDIIYKEDVSELRDRLDYALTALGIVTSSYTDSTLAGAPSGTTIKAVHIRELRTRSTSGAGSSTSGGSSGGLHYVLSDLQGSTRAVMNNNSSSSAVVARHDYLPFGEELGAIGGRTSGEGYSATDQNRWKYAMTERDATSGLDHTPWRKYESTSGRWTSPDPINGSVANPQSFNHFSYAANDPVNSNDPIGLFPTQFISDWLQANSGRWEVNVYPNDSPVEIPGSGELHVSWFDSRPLIGPQNSFATNNPAVIDNKDSGQDCNISVAFTGNSIHNVSNGKGYAGGNPGLGFTVSISDLGSGGIASIGENAVDSKGHWVLQQLMNLTYWTVRKGDSAPISNYVPTWSDPISPSAIIRNDTKSGGWFDHPGPNLKNSAGQELIADHSKWDFLIKAHNGNKNCSVAFHVEMTFSNGLFDAVWGPGLYNGVNK
ncbi:MAG TPA: hypothetical protein DC054_19410 [Blastocatellia bacterium]|nr:hypothetical protein [Blastocatellia bacterium]